MSRCKLMSRRGLLPEVSRRHQLEKSRLLGSTPAASTTCLSYREEFPLSVESAFPRPPPDRVRSQPRFGIVTWLFHLDRELFSALGERSAYS